MNYAKPCPKCNNKRMIDIHHPEGYVEYKCEVCDIIFSSGIMEKYSRNPLP